MKPRFPFPVAPLPRVRCDSFQAFEQEIKPARRAVILEGLLTPWDALTRWSIEYLSEHLSSDELDVYISPDRYFPGEYKGSPDGVFKSADGRRSTRMSGREFFRKLNSVTGSRHYLHAFPLPDVLAADVSIPPQTDREVAQFIWISMAGHVTPTHFDSSDNVLAQIVGSKRFVLFSPEQFENLYMYGCDHRYARHSQVFDLENVDLQRFPRIAQLTGVWGDVGPGDALYIPNFWGHCAYTLSAAASVNTWWNEMPFDQYAELIGEWIDLRERLFESLPGEMSARYKTYLARVLLFADMR